MHKPDPLRSALPQTLKAQADAHDVLRASDRFYQALQYKEPGGVRRYSRELHDLLKAKGVTDQQTQNLIAAMGQLYSALAAHARAQSGMTFDEVLAKVTGAGGRT